MNASVDARSYLIARLTEDVFGPSTPDEILDDKPSDRYLTGILFPQRTAIGADEDERLDAATGGDDDDGDDGAAEEVPTSVMRKPSAAGLTVRCEADAGTTATLLVHVTGGTYRREARREDTSDALAPDASTPAGDDQPVAVPARGFVWRRTDHCIALDPIVPGPGQQNICLDDWGLPGFRLHVTVAAIDASHLVTLVLVNDNEIGELSTLVPDELALFQVGIEVRPGPGTRLVARPITTITDDEDAAATQLLYRDVREYAVGHTCSVRWEADDDGTARLVATTWLPQQRVPLVSADGSRELQEAIAAAGTDPLLAEHLAAAKTGDEFRALLEAIPAGYEQWIARQEGRIADLPATLKEQGRAHLDECRKAASRIRRGIELIATDDQVRLAFRLTNRAMHIQRRWTDPGRPLRWRPFQLGFILQSLESIAEPRSADRHVMDLLWFPTGGGKTEAYLGLIAFTLFLRRLRRRHEPDHGGGTCCLMRYTLRLLTLQQFERASALILACEYLRRGHELPPGITPLTDTAEISIGLWVGGAATPNKFAEAEEALTNRYATSTPRQLTVCPSCRERLRWSADPVRQRIIVSCQTPTCQLGRAIQFLPLHTVDSQIYEMRPTLILGTVDKFAQIVRSGETAALFNAGTDVPPDLIVQDELHLISGPLGTLAAVYEVAVDLICSRAGYPPKIIGSTATIRRAHDQVRALFDRDVARFPPPGLDPDDSCFAVVPEDARDRRYVGISTAGRSAKFTLQTVYASLLQGASAITDLDVRDGYHTLVGYFNALRELGGALVLARDDVDATARLIARRRREQQRHAREVVELTSRVSQREIRELLDRLVKPCTNDDAVDVVLATNMISVGVDVGRLALMVVMGQPKGIAEYIQATSRVGRDRNPGLVVTVLNNAKARDRSYFESFPGWHQALYRGVEPTSVTPFASRARDRALHAAVVALARHLVPGMRDDPTLDASRRQAIEPLLDRIFDRAERVDCEEAENTRRELREILDLWQLRSATLQYYWVDERIRTALLISAEAAAARQMAGRTADHAWPTLNSMRNVEPGTPFRLTERLRE